MGNLWQRSVESTLSAIVIVTCSLRKQNLVTSFLRDKNSPEMDQLTWLKDANSTANSRETINSTSLSPGTKGFTCGKWIIGYNFDVDDGAESKLGTHKELIVLSILKYKYCVHKPRDMSHDHFDQLVAGFKKWNRAIVLF